MSPSVRRCTLWIIVGLMMAACEANTTATQLPQVRLDQAQRTMIQFFDDLASGEFRQAESVFAGDVQVLADWNPDVNPLYRVTLLERACLAQLNCLPVGRVVSAEQAAADRFLFVVEFEAADGATFALEPCCGITEAEMAPVTQFDCAVEWTADGQYKVLCLPPYVP